MLQGSYVWHFRGSCALRIGLSRSSESRDDNNAMCKAILMCRQPMIARNKRFISQIYSKIRESFTWFRICGPPTRRKKERFAKTHALKKKASIQDMNTLERKVKLWIDCDAGIDDAQGLGPTERAKSAARILLCIFYVRLAVGNYLVISSEAKYCRDCLGNSYSFDYSRLSYT